MKHVSKTECDFNELYEILWPQVYRFIYYKVQNAEEAEELTQDVFQKVFKQVKNNKINENKVKAYVFTAARNIIYDVWRKKRKKPKVIRLDELSEVGLEIGSNDSAIEANLMVQEALEQLSLEERRVLQLRILEGYQINEVAEMLGKPLGTIKSLQFRALQKLKDKLAKGGYFDE